MTKYEQLKKAVDDAKKGLAQSSVDTWDERLEKLRPHVLALQAFEKRAAELVEPLVKRLAGATEICRRSQGERTCKDCPDGDACGTYNLLKQTEEMA